MKKSLVLAMAMALGVTASAYAANPFSDVPAGHWAYDSVNKLVAAGVVDGYPDGTYGGDKLMTRYEMAQIVAKAMAKGANVDKLAAEFADELDTLGVRVANLEAKADNVKITGEVRYHYVGNDAENYNKGYATALRTRLYVNGQINEDWTYTGMLENNQNLKNDAGDEKVSFQRAYVNGRIGGVAVQAGRYSKALGEANVYDNRFDGIQASYGKDVKLTAGYGKATPSSVKTVGADLAQMNAFFRDNASITVDRDSDEVYYAEVNGKAGALGLTAGYYHFGDVNGNLHGETTSHDYMGKPIVHTKDIALEEDIDIWAFGADYAFNKDFKLGALYLKGDDLGSDIDDDGYVVTAAYKGAKASEVGSWGLVAKYYDQGATTYVHHTMNGVANDMFGFEGYSVAANYAFAKNIVGQVEYYDLEEKEGNREAQTLWSQVVFSF